MNTSSARFWAIFGGTVEFAAEVTDNVEVSNVWIEIFDPLGSSMGNFSMTYDTPSGKWMYSSVFTTVGWHTYNVRAKDTSNNWANAVGFFEIIQVLDTTPPTIINVLDIPDPQTIGGTVDFFADVIDNVGVSAVWLDIDGHGNYTMGHDNASGLWRHSAVFNTAQLYQYKVWAYDAAGNIASASGTLNIIDSGPPGDTPPVVEFVSAHPMPQLKGLPVKIYAMVSDDGVVASVHVKISNKNGFVLGNLSMTYNTTSRKWERTVTFDNAGGYSFVVWAKDDAGNFGWAPGSTNILNSVSKGNIRGRVVDSDGNPISGVTIQLFDEEGTFVTSYKTGDDGIYVFKDIPVGTYTIKIVKPGFELKRTGAISVDQGDTTDLGNTILVVDPLSNPQNSGIIDLPLLLIIILAIVFLGLASIVLYRRRKKR